ncbi:NF-kappa-B inhibitor delta [Ornithorhynchus anatinus]|uniref:NF-kappa-B inhibitor delta n=1 Tax=Ornithorhynchus anatinus TaxID=9258 RepID=UPI0010A803F9|nr:NF-kappa-B inhibitor delta [Ornithorhynchus anatinus]
MNAIVRGMTSGGGVEAGPQEGTLKHLPAWEPETGGLRVASAGTRTERATLAQRRGRGAPRGLQPEGRNSRGCRAERSPCPSTTVKKLLEQRRQQMGIDYDPAAPGPMPTSSGNTTGTGNRPFLDSVEAAGESLGMGPGPPQLPSWDPDSHATYPDCHYHCSSSAQAYFSGPGSGLSPLPDRGGYGPLLGPPEDLELPADSAGLCLDPTPPSSSWGGSGLGPTQFFQAPPQDTGPGGQSLEQARAEVRGFGLRRLLQQDEEGDTLLHLFAAQGLRWLAFAAAEVLQSCGQLDIREHKGKTPLLVAAAANQPLVVLDLLLLGAEPNATDQRGRSVLHMAAAYGLPAVLMAVCNSGVPVNLEARDFEGLTPLHTAVLSLNAALCPLDPPAVAPGPLPPPAQDRLTCVQMLLQMGADSTSQEIKSNKTALHLAVQGGNLPLVQLLLDLPVPDPPAFVNMKAHGHTALHMAAALPPQAPREPIVRRLLAAGADPTLRNLENEQAAHLLGPGPQAEPLRQLLKRSRGPAPVSS